MATTTTSSATTDTATVATTSSVTVDNTATKEQVAELYIATFGRAPDAGGLDYWTNEVVTGSLTLDGVAKSFFEQDEAQSMYGASSNEDFIISVYENALGRKVDGDDGGVQYWLDELDHGVHTKDTFIKAVLAGAKAETGDANDAALLENRVKTGLLYAEEIGTDNSPLAKQVMEKVTYDESTAEDAMGTISYYKDWVSKYDVALGDKVDTDELYSHINDDDYWTELEQTHELNFDAEPAVKFWEQDDALWEDSISLDSGSTFDFLDNKEAWADASEYQSFKGGEFAHIDIDSIFSRNDIAELKDDYKDGEFEDVKDSDKLESDDKSKNSEKSESSEINSSELEDHGNSYKSDTVSHISDGFDDGFSMIDLSGLMSFNESHIDYTYGATANVDSTANNVELAGVATTDVEC